MDKPHQVICHVCGVEHTIMCDFLVGGTKRTADGRELVTVSCGAHTGAEIRAAWLAR